MFNFNHPINSWDTSNVTNMSSMFFSSRAFNQPINIWDTSKVTNKVTNMPDMFNNAVAFIQPLNSWNTSNITDMQQMFCECRQHIVEFPYFFSTNSPFRNAYKPSIPYL